MDQVRYSRAFRGLKGMEKVSVESYEESTGTFEVEMNQRGTQIKNRDKTECTCSSIVVKSFVFFYFHALNLHFFVCDSKRVSKTRTYSTKRMQSCEILLPKLIL